METLTKLPKWIEFKDGEDRKLLHLKITYLPFNKMWEIRYDDIFGSVTSWKLCYDSNIKKCILKMKKKMEEVKKDLIKISTFAKEKDVSVQSVYKWIEKGEVKCVEIDGIKFIDKKTIKN